MPPSEQRPRARKIRSRILLSKLVRLDWRNRLLLLEATLWLAFARLSLFVPFRWLAPRLGETMAESPVEDGRESDLGVRVAWAVRIASRYTPWGTKCLAEAIAAKAMLRLRGVPTTLYLGLAKDETGGLSAHAWLRCGRSFLTGEKTMDGFTVVAKFAETHPG